MEREVGEGSGMFEDAMCGNKLMGQQFYNRTLSVAGCGPFTAHGTHFFTCSGHISERQESLGFDNGWSQKADYSAPTQVTFPSPDCLHACLNSVFYPLLELLENAEIR